MDINITLIGQMITFAIFVGFTMKFVWPPLRKALDERRERLLKVWRLLIGHLES